MTRTPLELLMVDALGHRRRAETLERKATEAASAQWRLYYTQEAAVARAAEEYLLGRAWDHAALFVDGEPDA